jgi:hypothetical protein
MLPGVGKTETRILHCIFLFAVFSCIIRIRFSTNQNIGEGESNFDEKNVEEMFN